MRSNIRLLFAINLTPCCASCNTRIEGSRSADWQVHERPVWAGFFLHLSGSGKKQGVKPAQSECPSGPRLSGAHPEGP